MAVNPDTITAPGGPFTIREVIPTEPNTITLQSGSEEMIKVGPDGFWVRGKKIKQDDREAQIVYNAFKEWLTWAQLNKDYK